MISELRDSSPGLAVLAGAESRTPEELLEAAQASEFAGDWAAADALYSALFQQGLRHRSPDVITDALRFHARVHRVQRRLEEAEELAELSWEIARRHQLTLQAARAVNMIAAIRHQRGELPQAKALYELALEQARDVGDDTLIGFACQNLGVIANIEGNLREARTLYLECISASIRAENESGAMMAYSNLGLVCGDLGDWMEAEIYFDRGIEIARRLGDNAQLARLYVNRTEPLIQVDELEHALASLDRAEEFAARTEDRSITVDGARFRGRIERLRGDLAAAERHLERALAVAGEGNLALARAEALEELACLRRAQRRTAEALEALQAALEGYRDVGAARDAARAAELLAQWQADGGEA